MSASAAAISYIFASLSTICFVSGIVILTGGKQHG